MDFSKPASPSFGRVVFKDKSIYAKYGNGIVGKIRCNKAVDSFKKRDDFDIIFSATASKTTAEFYWQIRKNGGIKSFFQNFLCPKIHFKSSQLAIKPIVEEITEKSVNTYISKYFS